MKKIKVVVLMGGKSSEREVSLMSGGEVLKNLNIDKYEVYSIDFDGSYSWVEKIKPDVVFIALHGKNGEDGQVQGMLESFGIKYVGSDSEVCKKGFNKISFSTILENKGITVPKTQLIKNKEEVEKNNLIFPLVVKPVLGGSSIGISIVKEKEVLDKAINEAFKYDSQILIQEYIKGTEITCGIIGNNELLALPLVEICPKREFFDYESKYNSELCEEIIPARISEKMKSEIQDLAKRIYKIIGCRGFARVDFIVKDGVYYPLEVNLIPGMTSNSLLPKEAAAVSINYPQLLDKIIELALEN
jgi:D-alanine-D-alanine ligase